MALYYPHYNAFERGLVNIVTHLSYEDAAKVYNLAAELSGEQKLHPVFVDEGVAFVGDEHEDLEQILREEEEVNQ